MKEIKEMKKRGGFMSFHVESVHSRLFQLTSLPKKAVLSTLLFNLHTLQTSLTTLDFQDFDASLHFEPQRLEIFVGCVSSTCPNR